MCWELASGVGWGREGPKLVGALFVLLLYFFFKTVTSLQDHKLFLRLH